MLEKNQHRVLMYPISLTLVTVKVFYTNIALSNFKLLTLNQQESRARATV